jgi:hypothetical protein
LAQQNLLANIAAGRGLQFRYQGPGTGTSPLPNMLGFLTGKSPGTAGNCNTVATCNALYSGTLWANATFTTALNPLNANPLGFAGVIAGTANESIFGPNRIAAGLPANFFVVNPGKRGGAFLFTNEGETTYDGLTIEFRRRFARGLLVQSSYTFSKALSNMYASNADIFDQPATLRKDLDNRRGVTPFDVTQSFKTNFIYELPVGRGQQFFGGASGWVDKLVGGWGFNGNIRIQSGSPFSLGNVQLPRNSRMQSVFTAIRLTPTASIAVTSGCCLWTFARTPSERSTRRFRQARTSRSTRREHQRAATSRPRVSAACRDLPVGVASTTSFSRDPRSSVQT